MKLLIFPLLLQLIDALHISNQVEFPCPHQGEITKANLSDIVFAAKARVKRVIKNEAVFKYFVYKVEYLTTPYFSDHTLDESKRKRPFTIAIDKKCPKLKDGITYLVACTWCRCPVMRELDQLTKKEEKAIKLKGATSDFNFLEWEAL
ncbi:hypothetical protein ANCCAN_14220 [Ancylostoma caninum]|uniref:Uncharacterized protein n=1 Tax=Ancylostoma caninum TaxID=29170 RepID=A0A368G5Z1_ANCCA|nr:hypothetical protein ANCCAN_14220 [Ancylostoma caninum]